MRNTFLDLVFITILLCFYSIVLANGTDKLSTASDTFYPAKENITLTYSTSFGETKSKFIYKDQNLVSVNESDKFKYRQKLNIQTDGVYVTETYQYIKLFFFINKEATYTYNKPLLRLPIPLTPGKCWNWEGTEYSDGDSSTVSVTGKIFNKELITVPAGKFDAIRIETKIESSSKTKNTIIEWYAEDIGLIKASISIEGGGFMGMARDLLGYGEINFELKEIKKD
jgi:hypothetical protein